MSKYYPLWQHIQKNNQDNLVLSFDDVKNILGFKIDHSFLNYKKELTTYGYQVAKISLKEKKVNFTKI
jgi:6-pyruvoyl-tetrahydropterin synthase